jgi:hypothetical protein
MASLFERNLSVSTEELEFTLRGQRFIPWLEFVLNPRRLRGSDFLMRWSQGVWSERRLVEAVSSTQRYFALEYGPSSAAPEGNVREYELYFELLEKAGLGDVKRPDLLVFMESDREAVDRVLANLDSRYDFAGQYQGDDFSFLDKLQPSQKLPFISEQDANLLELISKSLLAVECENSLWKAGDMPSYGEDLRPMKRLGGKPGLPKNAVVPTIIIKEEDRTPLQRWQDHHNKSIHIWHVFFDMAYGISLDKANELFEDGLIEKIEQVYQAPAGATTKKAIYKIYYHYAYPVGVSEQEPELQAKYIADKNGHILPYVHFKGGSLCLAKTAKEVLKDLEQK